MKRGDVYQRPPRGRLYVVVSADALIRTGTVVVAEVVESAPERRGMIAVPLSDARGDAVPGAVRADLLGYVNVDRMGEFAGRLDDTTMELVDMALRAVLDLD